MASGASPLENELVAFVEGHPETFGPQDVVNMRRNIIYRFGFVDGGSGAGTDPNRRALGVLVNDVLTHISKKVNGISMNAFHDVQYVLNQFELSVEFINAFLERLCNTERNYNPGGYVSGGSTHRSECEKQREWIHPSSRPLYAGEINIFEFVKIKINEYQSRILKLWADGLIHEGKITPDAIAEMHAAVAGTDGYERKMRELHTECNERGGFRPNLDESMLLKWLALFHVAKIEQMTKTYSNLGSLDLIIAGIISQFVPLHNVHGHSYIPQSKNHDSELNMLHLTCNVIARNSGQQLPVSAYLSSDVLDQCVQSVRRFPTTDQFIQHMNARMIEKAAAFAAPPPSAAPPPPPPPSAPALSELDGGRKKTRRKAKKNKNVRRSHRH